MARNPLAPRENLMAEQSHVVVTDIQMPFSSMVMFMVKWVIAAVPAMIILAILVTVLGAVFAGLGGRWS